VQVVVYVVYLLSLFAAVPSGLEDVTLALVEKIREGELPVPVGPADAVVAFAVKLKCELTPVGANTDVEELAE